MQSKLQLLQETRTTQVGCVTAALQELDLDELNLAELHSDGFSRCTVHNPVSTLTARGQPILTKAPSPI